MVRNLSPGDKVLVRHWDERPSHWNSQGLMDKWQGEAVTVRSVNCANVKIEEDADDRPRSGYRGWNWNLEDFILLKRGKIEDPNKAFKFKHRRNL